MIEFLGGSGQRPDLNLLMSLFTIGDGRRENNKTANVMRPMKDAATMMRIFISCSLAFTDVRS